MERRDFIKKLFVGTGVGVGVAVAGSAGLVGYYQPRKALYGREASGGKERVDGLKKVVVIGGGLAGISSSIELARRGFEVTLVESSAALGGKLTGWDIEALVSTFRWSMGFMAFLISIII